MTLQDAIAAIDEPLLLLGILLVWWRRTAVVGMAAIITSGLARCAHHALTRSDHGWDMLMYCGALHAADDGHSPYLVANIRRCANTTLSYAYPMFTAQFARPACDDAYRPGHVAWFAAVLALSLVLLQRMRASGVRWPDHVYGATLVLTGFVGTMWNLLSGNLAVIEFVFFAGGLLALDRGRTTVAGLLLGIMAALKLSFVLMLLPVVLFHPWKEHRARLRLLLAMVAGGLLVHVVSVATHPGFYLDYWRQVLGTLDAKQHTPIRELTGGRSDPSLILVVHQALKLVGVPSLTMAVLAALALLAPLVMTWWRALRGDALSGLQRMCAGVLVLSLAAPRLKPYTFLHLTAAVWILSVGLSHQARALVLTVACGAAAASYWDGAQSSIPVVMLVLKTMQLWTLYAVVLILGVHFLRHRSNHPAPT